MGNWIKNEESKSFHLRGDLFPIWTAVVRNWGKGNWDYILGYVPTEKAFIGKGGFSSAKKAKDEALKAINQKLEK
jgi:hypothetical protein